MNGPVIEDLEDRLRRSLRTVAHATAVPDRPELLLPGARPRAGWRVLAIAAAVIAILGVIAFAELAGGLRQAGPAGPGPGSDDPLPAVEKLVSLDQPEEAKAELEGTFRALDLDVTMGLVPVESGRVGRVIGVEGGIEVDEEDCADGVPECRIRVIAPPGFTGHGVVIVGIESSGLPAAGFQVAADAFAAGQPLHCHPELLGVRIRVAQRRAEALGLRVRATIDDLEYEPSSDDRVYVNGARLMSAGTVVFDVQPDPYHPPASRLRVVRAGC